MQVDFLDTLTHILAPLDLKFTRIAPPFDNMKSFDYGLRDAIDPEFDWVGFGQELLAQIPRYSIVFAHDVFELKFAFFRIPDDENAAVCIGPWSVGERSAASVKWTEANMDAECCATIQKYYDSVRILDAPFTLETGLYSAVSILYPGTELRVERRQEFRPMLFHSDTRNSHETVIKRDFSADMIEARYAQENRILEAVQRGDKEAAILAATQYTTRYRMQPRLSNPLRERKNYLIILNALLRKSIEKAHIHPYYIDELSESFFCKIESLTSEQECTDCSYQMVQEYCNYVQKYSLQNYSPIVQKVINYINLNLHMPLSLKTISEMCFVSPSYLSTLFKQEVGQTLTDYINTARVERAGEHLIRTEANIATIAMNVGVPDVNYFTKIFRKVTGMTPSTYRKKNRNSSL